MWKSISWVTSDRTVRLASKIFAVPRRDSGAIAGKIKPRSGLLERGKGKVVIETEQFAGTGRKGEEKAVVCPPCPDVIGIAGSETTQSGWRTLSGKPAYHGPDDPHLPSVLVCIVRIAAAEIEPVPAGVGIGRETCACLRVQNDNPVGVGPEVIPCMTHEILANGRDVLAASVEGDM